VNNETESGSAARVRLDWTPHPGQRDVLASDARFRIVACGRRWGKTEMSAYEAARYLGVPDALVWWVAPTYDIADIGFAAVEDALPGPLVAEVKRSKPKSITLKNGSMVSFRSADREDSLRGEGLDLLILDEAAMVPERAWANELRPTLTDTRGDMVAISTPKGRGWFYRWFERGQTEDHPDAASWRAPTAENPHIDAEEIEAAKREVPDRVFEQEYLARFLDESGGVFTDLDTHLFKDGWEYDLPIPAEYTVGPFATGVDFARHQDYRVIITLDGAGRVVYFDRSQHETWPQIQAEVEDVAARYPGVVAVDASRDNKIVSDLETAGLHIEPVQFSATRKRGLIEDLVARIEAGDLTAPELPQLRHELEIFEYDVTAAGNVRYQAPEGFHDDCVDALALAADAWEESGRHVASSTITLGGMESEERRTFRESDIGRALEAHRRKQDSPWS
jgi:hypothetical protein